MHLSWEVVAWVAWPGGRLKPRLKSPAGREACLRRLWDGGLWRRAKEVVGGEFRGLMATAHPEGRRCGDVAMWRRGEGAQDEV